jgi:hypothetical protein
MEVGKRGRKEGGFVAGSRADLSCTLRYNWQKGEMERKKEEFVMNPASYFAELSAQVRRKA